MKTFYCDHCQGLVFFDNVTCLQCGHALGFIPELLDVTAYVSEADGTVRPLSAATKGRTFRSCVNATTHGTCNWLVREDDPESLCESCRITEVIPNLSVDGNLDRWRRIEMAKRRLLYTLLDLNLPFHSAAKGGAGPGLRFQFLDQVDGTNPVHTGHSDGLIVLNIIEADDAERERRRTSLHEPFRTLLGHFRHESGHYFWDRLIKDTLFIDKYREIFGDEREDYGAALQRHYSEGPPADWMNKGVSAYATAHSWEDWAETWAHYLHIVDTIETASGFGLVLKPRHPAAASMTADTRQLPRAQNDFDALMALWYPVTYAANALNRSMGLPDLYPFVLSPAAETKLRFIHEVIHAPRIPETQPAPIQDTASPTIETPSVAQKVTSPDASLAAAM